MASLLLALMVACSSKQQAATATEPKDTTSAQQGGLEDSTFQDPTVGTTPADSQGTALPKPTTGSTDSAGTETPSSPTTGTPDSSETQVPDSPVTGNPDSTVQSLDYKTFKAMTATQKKAYQESFESMDAFFEWYNAAYEAYREANPPTEIDGSGVVTLP